MMLPHWPRLGVGPVLPTVGVVVKTALKSNLVSQPPFLATVANGGPAGGGAGHPCLVAWHHGETALGYYNASGYPGFSMFTPNLRGGLNSAPNLLCYPDLALGPIVGGQHVGARPLGPARVTLQNHGFVNGAYPGLGQAAPATGVKIPVARPAGIDAGQCATTGQWKYNQHTPAQNLPLPPNVARQGPRLVVHDVRTGAAGDVPVTDSGTGDLRCTTAQRKFGFMCHVQDLLGRDKHLQDLRDAAALLGRHLRVCSHFVRLTPDAEICDAMLPNGDLDCQAAYMLTLGGPNATRASWDRDVSPNLYAVIVGGPDAYTTESWHATPANGHARLQRCDQSNNVNISEVNRGSHWHVVYITVELSPMTPAASATPEAQMGIDSLHRFHRRCAIGQEELIESTAGSEVNLFNYFQNVVIGVTGDIKVLGYSCVGKHGCRHSDWRPPANWARRVLHAANLQTEWSEHPDQPIRGTAGRMAFVARMPFCGPGVAAAYATLPNLPHA